MDVRPVTLARLAAARGAPALPLPRFVQIEPVGQCNLRCRMCPIQYRRDGPPWGPLAFMDFALFLRLLDQFPGMEELHLQGMGEPMMHPRFFDMVAAAAGRGVRVSTNSNLTLVSQRRARECVGSGLSTLHVSLDGASASTYEFIRRGARFAKVLRNLDRVIAARGGARRPEVRLVAVAMRANLAELPALVRLAAEHGVDAMSVQHLCHDFAEAALPERYRPMRGFVDAQSLLCEDPAVVARHFDAARKQAAALGLPLRLPALRARRHDPATPGRERCDWPWRGAYLSYRGDAMPCCMVSTPDRACFGNMAREDAAAVWNNDAYQDFRARLGSASPPEVCAGCALYRGTF